MTRARLLAAHEAAHAIAGRELGCDVDSITLDIAENRGACRLVCETLPARDRLVIAVAGMTGELLALRERNLRHHVALQALTAFADPDAASSSDLRVAGRALRELCGRDRRRAVRAARSAVGEAELILRRRRSEWLALAGELEAVSGASPYATSSSRA